MTAPATADLHGAVLDWYSRQARDLPWRRPGTTPWAVMVSEFMLQQTPVSRVVPVYETWLQRWPQPAALAADSSGEAIRAWGRLGYPRRALRLHAAAQVIVDRHAGSVPSSYDELRSLPGVGDYTAAAIASFAFGGRHVVLDTNVRRVLGRLVAAEALPGPAVTATERARALALLPSADLAPRWAVATMELGATVCTARAPACGECVLAPQCAWRRAGRPAYAGPARARQSYNGTDRQARGALLALLRIAPEPVSEAELAAAWAPEAQRRRALTGLVVDGLVQRTSVDRWALP